MCLIGNTLLFLANLTKGSRKYMEGAMPALLLFFSFLSKQKKNCSLCYRGNRTKSIVLCTLLVNSYVRTRWLLIFFPAPKFSLFYFSPFVFRDEETDCFVQRQQELEHRLILASHAIY